LGDSRPTRWKLRAAIRLVNQTLAELHVEQHPDKTFIGRISRGFDFLGYTFTPAGLDVAPQTVERCVERLSRLYEQDVDLLPPHRGLRPTLASVDKERTRGMRRTTGLA